MDPLQGYRTEAGDVLLSVQLVLGAEAAATPADQQWLPAGPAMPRRIDSTSFLAEGAAADAVAWLPSSWGPGPHMDRGSRAAHPSAGGPGRPGPVELMLIDAGTGAGTVRALRRDLAAARAWGTPGSGPSIVSLAVEPLREIRAREGDAVAEAMLRAVVDVVPFMVRARDRVYRTGPDELALLMHDTDDEGAEWALERLVEKVPKVLAERRLGEIRLIPRLRGEEDLAPAASG